MVIVISSLTLPPPHVLFRACLPVQPGKEEQVRSYLIGRTGVPAA